MSMRDTSGGDTRLNDTELRAGMTTPAWAGKVVGAVFGFVFLGIGLTVLIAMWTRPFGAFGAPPLFFRVVASFIAIAFVTVGGGISLAAIMGQMTGRSLTNRSREKAGNPTMIRQGDSAPANYVCPQCGAPLDDRADVSPHGDVKCGYCKGWFNIHGH